MREIIDWLVSSELRQWQAMSEHGARRQQHADRIVGRVGRSFDYDRTRLLDSVGRTAQRSIESFDREPESSRLADTVKMAVTTRRSSRSARSASAPLTHLAITASADFTGILAAGTVAVLGFFIIPNRRRNAKKELRDKIESCANCS